MNKFARFVFLPALLAPVLAAAQTVGGGSDPTTILNALITWLTGPFGTSLAILIVMGAGIAFMVGRFALLHLVGVIAGITIMFSAAYLVQTVLGI